MTNQLKSLLMILLLSASALTAQMIRVDPSPVMTTAGNSAAGGSPALFGVSNASISLCSDAACTLPVTTYANAAGSTSCSTSAQVTLPGSTLCRATSGPAGQFGFWVPAGTYYYTVTTSSGLRYGPYPVTAGSLTTPMALADPGPAWASSAVNYASLSVNMNSYPANAYFGDNTGQLPEAIRGAINIPSNANGTNHGAGLAGYALSASTAEGSVGGFMFGGKLANNVSSWGGNVLVTNCGQPQCSPSTGFDGNGQGIEVDVNWLKKAGAVTPTGALYGVGIIGASEVKPAGSQAFAIHVEALGFNQSPKVGWDAVLYSEDGASSVGLDLGTTGAGNGVGSQSIKLHARDGGAVDRTATITADSTADIVMEPGLAGQIILEDNGGNIGAQLVPNGTTPYFYVPNQLRIAAGTFAARPTAVAAGVLYLCTDCASGCAAGAGSARLAISTGAGTTFTCY